MTFALVLALFKRAWPFLLGAAVVVLAYNWAYDRGAEHQKPISYLAGQLAQDKVWKDATEKNRLEQEKSKKETEGNSISATKAVDNDTQGDLANLGVQYADWMRKWNEAHPTSVGQSNLSGVSRTTVRVEDCPDKLDIKVALPLIREGDTYREDGKAWSKWYDDQKTIYDGSPIKDTP